MKYTIEKDHNNIKIQIKEWEQRLDNIVDCYLNKHKDLEDEITNELENISHEMCAINI